MTLIKVQKTSFAIGMMERPIYDLGHLTTITRFVVSVTVLIAAMRFLTASIRVVTIVVAVITAAIVIIAPVATIIVVAPITRLRATIVAIITT